MINIKWIRPLRFLTEPFSNFSFKYRYPYSVTSWREKTNFLPREFPIDEIQNYFYSSYRDTNSPILLISNQVCELSLFLIREKHSQLARALMLVNHVANVRREKLLKKPAYEEETQSAHRKKILIIRNRNLFYRYPPNQSQELMKIHG